MPYTPNAAAAFAGTGSGSGLTDYQYMIDASNRSQAILQTNPWLASDPQALQQLATSNIGTFDLTRHAATLYATGYADRLAGIMSNQSEDNQRLIWNGLTTDQQAALNTLGYDVPKTKGQGIHIPGQVGGIIGGGVHLINTVLTAPGIKQGLNALTWLGDQPAHVYRTIRMLPDNAQRVGLGGALVGLAAAALAPETGGLSLGFVLGAGGLLGASAASMAVVGPNDWIRTFRNTWNGERVFLPSAQKRARELLGSDRLAGLAADLADHGDLTAFAESLAGNRDATNPGVWQRSFQKYADQIVQPGDPRHDAVVTALQEISRVPEFVEAVRTLQDGKISFGRDAARVVGLRPGDRFYGLVSGGLDAAWVMTLDPTLAAGQMLAWNKARRYGMALEGISDLGAALTEKADKIPAIGRAFDEAARSVATKDADIIRRNVPAFKDAWDGALAYAKQQGIENFSRKDLIDYISKGEGLKQFMSGAGTRVNETQTLLPRFGYKIGPVVLKPTELRSWAKSVIDIADSNRSYAALHARLRFMDRAFTDSSIEAIRSKLGYANIALPDVATEYNATRTMLGALDKVPGVNSVMRQAGTLLGAATSMLPMNAAIRLAGPGSFDDMHRFVEMGRLFGMDDVQRRLWRNMLLNAEDVGARRDIVRSFLDAGLTTAGIRDTAAGKEMVDEFLSRASQAYGVGDKAEMAGGFVTRGRTELDQAMEIPFPSVKELQRAVRKGTLTQVMADVTGLKPLDIAMNGVWKPAVLLRIGFIPRNAGEEMLGWFARHGPSEYLAQFGYRSVADGQLHDEFSTLQAAGKKAWHPDAPEWTDDQIKSLERLKYAAHVRPIERLASSMKWSEPFVNVLDNYTRFLRRVLSEGLAPDSWELLQRPDVRGLTTEWGARGERFRSAIAGRPESFRRLLLAGADPETVMYSKLFTQRFGESIMRSLSAESANLAGDYSRAGQDRIVVHAGDSHSDQPVELGIKFGSYRAYGPGDAGHLKMTQFSVGRALDSSVYGPAKVELYYRTRPGVLRSAANESLIGGVDKLYQDHGDSVVTALLGEVLGSRHAQWGPTLDRIGRMDPETAALLHRDLPDLPTHDELGAWLRKNRKVLDLTQTQTREITNVLNQAKSLPELEGAWLAGRGRWMQSRVARSPEPAFTASLRARLDRANQDLYSFDQRIKDGIHPDAPYFTHPMVQDAQDDLLAAQLAGDPAAIAEADQKLAEARAIAAPDLARSRTEWTQERLDSLRASARAASDDYASEARHARPLAELQANLRSAENEAVNGATENDRLLGQWDKQRIQEQINRWYPQTVDPAMIPRPSIVPHDLASAVGEDPSKWLDTARHEQDAFLQRAHEQAHMDPRHQQALAGMEWNRTMSDGTAVINPHTAAGTVTHVPVISSAAAEGLVNDLALKGRQAVRDELRQVIADSFSSLSPEDAKRLANLGDDVLDQFVNRLAVEGADGWSRIVADLADSGAHGSLPLAVMAFDDAATARVLSRIIEKHYIGEGPSALEAFASIGELHGPKDLAALGPVTRDGWRRPMVTQGDGFTWNIDPHLLAHRVEPAEGNLVTLANGQTRMGATWEQASKEHAAHMVADASQKLRPKGEAGVELAWDGLAGTMWDKADEMAGTGLWNSRGLRTPDASALRARLLDQPTERVFRGRWEDWSGHVTPEQVLGPQLVLEDRQSAWQRFVQFGFGKVIGPSLDAAIRTPMATHAFVEAMKAGRPAKEWLRHPETWAAFEEHFGDLLKMAEKPTPELVADLRRVLPSVESPKLIAGLTDEELPRFAADLFKDPEALAAVKALPGADAQRVAEHPWALHSVAESPDPKGALVALYKDHLGESLGHGWPAVRNASKDMPEVLKSALNAQSAGVLDKAARNDERILNELGDYASRRAVATGFQFIDSHEIRSQYGQMAKSFTPFWYAEENFLKRWGRTLALNPAAIREGMLLYNGLKSGGIVKTDATGKDWFVYPGSGLLTEMLGKITPLGNVLPAGPIFAAQPSSMLPGFNPSQLGVPSASPLLALGMDQVVHFFPELKPAEQSLVGNGAVDQGALSRFVPPILSGMWETFTKDQDTSRRYASAMMAAAQVLEATGHGLPDNATDNQVDEWQRDLRNSTRTILFAQRLGGFILPGSPQLQFTGDSSTDLNALTGTNVNRAPDVLRQEYLQLVQQLGIEKGTIEWIKFHGTKGQGLNDLVNPEAYAVAQTESPSGAPIPATPAALKWAQQHNGLLERYPDGAPWLLPNDPGVKTGFDHYVYTQQVIDGLRAQRTPEDFMRQMKFKEGGVEYFTAKDFYESKRNRLDQAGQQDAVRALDLRWKQWADTFKAQHPVFTTQLESGEGQKRRQDAVTQIRTMLQDPEYPMDQQAQDTKQLLDSYDFYRYEVQRRSIQRDAQSVRDVAAFKERFSVWVSNWLGQHPNMQSMWLTLLRPDAQLT